MNAPAHDRNSRIVLVTGASRGIGRAAALAFARAGAHVVALARTQGALEELDDEIRALRPDEESPATLVPLDLRDFAALDRLGEALYRRWGRLDALVGNAGVLGVLSPLHHVDPKDWDDVLAVNVTANWRLHPLARSAVAPLGRGPRGVRHLGRARAARTCAPTGAPTRCRRRRSTRSRGPTRPRPSTPRTCASCWSIPGRCAR